MSAQLSEVSLLIVGLIVGVGTVLRLERDAWSMVKGLRRAANEYAPPPPRHQRRRASLISAPLCTYTRPNTPGTPICNTNLYINPCSTFLSGLFLPYTSAQIQPYPMPFGRLQVGRGSQSRGFAACLGGVFRKKRKTPGGRKTRLDQQEPHPAQSFVHAARAHRSSSASLTRTA